MCQISNYHTCINNYLYVEYIQSSMPKKKTLLSKRRRSSRKYKKTINPRRNTGRRNKTRRNKTRRNTSRGKLLKRQIGGDEVEDLEVNNYYVLESTSGVQKVILVTDKGEEDIWGRIHYTYISEAGTGNLYKRNRIPFRVFGSKPSREEYPFKSENKGHYYKVHIYNPPTETEHSDVKETKYKLPQSDLTRQYYRIQRY